MSTPPTFPIARSHVTKGQYPRGYVTVDDLYATLSKIRSAGHGALIIMVENHNEMVCPLCPIAKVDLDLKKDYWFGPEPILYLRAT